MPTYTVTFRPTTAITGTTGTAASRDDAVTKAAQIASTGPTGTEGDVYTCDLIGMTGPTGIYRSTLNTTGPLTGSTFSATSREDAVAQAAAVGPTGPGAGLAVFQTTP